VAAFATALILALLGDLAIVLYSKRREPGRFLSWGEAMLATGFAFVMFNLWYGVIPHQWITLADNEWGWRSDRILLEPMSIGSFTVQPLTVSYQAARDIVVLLIYGVALSLHIFHWAQWQDRAKPKETVVPTTTYGRPLARKS
jgi:hypothetical protein